MNTEETITLVVCMSESDGADVLNRCANGERFQFPVSWPGCYPEKGEVWMRIVCKTVLLPPLQFPLDGDACYECGHKELAEAVEIRPFHFDELVENALGKIDNPRPEHDFPFGWKDGARTWREVIEAGEETHPVWIEAHRLTRTSHR